MTIRRALARWAIGSLVASVSAPLAAHGVPIQVVYNDTADQGFFDPIRGTERRAAFQAAVDQWAATLAGAVPVVIQTEMPSLGGTGVSALLASTAAVTLHRNFSGAPFMNTWYPAALADQFAGIDLNGTALPEIDVRFNGDVDGPAVLGSVNWYYGLDGQPGADVDFLTIALHEIGHGLGFTDTIDATDGTFALGDAPSIFEQMLTRPEIGSLSTMLPAERLAAIVASGDLFFCGPGVIAFNGSPRSVYTPDPFQPGSSVAHWNTDPPPELMAPFYSGPIHEFGTLLPALVDMGWQLAGASPTPRSAPATPTGTLPPRPSATPATPRSTDELLYVANFDDSTVSVINAASRAVTQTVEVGDGPLGLAASPDGTRVYVANFRDGTISVVRTGDNLVIATVPVGDSPNAIAATSDGAFLAVTDTAADQVAIVTTDTLEVIARIPAGEQPSGIALDGADRAFVTDFSGATVTVVDLNARRRRALIPVPFATASDGLLGIAIAPQAGTGYIAALYGEYARALSADNLTVASNFGSSFPTLVRFEAVVTNTAGSTAYLVGQAPDTGAGSVTVVQMSDSAIVATVPVGLVPEALTLSRGEGLLYVANTGGDTVSIVNPTSRRVVATVPVGHAPSGIVAVAVPQGQCPAECGTPAGTASATIPPTATQTPSAVATPERCFGDCDGNGTVMVTELITLVDIALGAVDPTACPGITASAHAPVAIADIVRAVANALNGCVEGIAATQSNGRSL